jgi:hypothetical protein
MAIEQWPDQLGCLLIDGYSEQQQPVTIRSEVDVGPAKIRRRFTAPITLVQGRIIVDRAQADELLRFFNLRLAGGVEQFKMQSPLDLAEHKYRFITPPAFASVSSSHFVATLDLERLT